MTRRFFLQRFAQTGLFATGLLRLPSVLRAAEAGTPLSSRCGIGMYSFMNHWKAIREQQPETRFRTTLQFIDYCHALGAAGVQVSLDAPDMALATAVRQKTEQFGMYFEGQANLPKTEADLSGFGQQLALIRETGATIVRAALLSGRRYETFKSEDEFRSFQRQAVHSIELAEPILRRHRLRVAIENHKDWRVPEMIEWLRRFSSEHIGVCVDTGNNIALAEEPFAVVKALAPFAASCHLKDMAVQPYDSGFLLSEVPFGRGLLDLEAIVETLRTANPQLRFNVEMITRDPLPVPCLTERYWATMPDTSATVLAATLGMVRRSASAEALPRTTGLSVAGQLRLEEENVRLCLASNLIRG